MTTEVNLYGNNLLAFVKLQNEGKNNSNRSSLDKGICEHHNSIITRIILKVTNDTNCDWEIALTWAIIAKNCLRNANGSSPHQIVLGKNINLPSIYNDKPSAYLPQNEILIEHLSVLHGARQTFRQKN